MCGGAAISLFVNGMLMAPRVQGRLRGEDMVLTLTNEEIDIVKRALLNHIGSLRDEARRCAYSPNSIKVCQQRARAEELLDRLASGPPPKLRLVA